MRHLVLGILLLSLIGCNKGKGGSSEGLDVVVSPDRIYINRSATESCKEALNPPTDGSVASRSVAGPRVSFRSFSISWSRENPLYISNVVLSVDTTNLGGAKGNVEIAADEIDALFLDYDKNTRWEASCSSTSTKCVKTYVGGGKILGSYYDPTSKETLPTVITSNEKCRLSFGGIPISDGLIEKGAFKTSAKITVYGFEYTSDGDIPVKIQIPVSLESLF